MPTRVVEDTDSDDRPRRAGPPSRAPHPHRPAADPSRSGRSCPHDVVEDTDPDDRPRRAGAPRPVRVHPHQTDSRSSPKRTIVPARLVDDTDPDDRPDRAHALDRCRSDHRRRAGVSVPADLDVHRTAVRLDAAGSRATHRLAAVSCWVMELDTTAGSGEDLAGLRGDCRPTGCAVPLDAALEALYPSLRRFAAVVASSDGDPDDLVQEAVVRLLRRRRDRRGPRRLPAPDHGQPGGEPPARSRSPAGGAAAACGSDESKVADYPSDLSVLDVLDPLDRSVVFLIDVDGWPSRQVAEQLGLSDSAVRTRATRARADPAHASRRERTMNDVDDLLERAATRGTPRGVDRILNDARGQATRRRHAVGASVAVVLVVAVAGAVAAVTVGERLVVRGRHRLTTRRGRCRRNRARRRSDRAARRLRGPALGRRRPGPPRDDLDPPGAGAGRLGRGRRRHRRDRPLTRRTESTLLDVFPLDRTIVGAGQPRCTSRRTWRWPTSSSSSSG